MGEPWDSHATPLHRDHSLVNKDRVCVGKETGMLVGNRTKQASHLHQRRSKFSGGSVVTTWLREWLGRKTRKALRSHVTLPDLYTQLYRMEPHSEHISNVLADRAVLTAPCLQHWPVNENRRWGYRWEGHGGCVSNICFHAFVIFCIFLKFYRPHNLNFIFYIFSYAHSPELPVILCYRGFMYFF